jgi:predicted transcriptional regulator
MPTHTIRASDKAKKTLKDLADARGVSMTQVLDEVLEAQRRREILERANREFAALRADPVAWAEELEERRLWEATLMDDLRNDPWEEKDE